MKILPILPVSQPPQPIAAPLSPLPSPQQPRPVAPQVRPPRASAPQPPTLPDLQMPPLSHIANIPTGVNLNRSAPPVVKPLPKTQPLVEQSPAQSMVPAQSTSPTAGATPSPNIKKSPLQLVQPQDMQTLSLETLRTTELQSIVDSIQNLITEYGYFAVLQLLEASPLYNSYMEAGQDKLQGNTSTMTQEEFEFMTDLLIHMKFNRW